MNSKGIITVDFLFALVIAFGMSALVFSLTFTLSVVEVTQYIAFSAARAQSAGNYDMGTQEKAARDKYASLIANPAFSNLFTNGWFEISKKQDLEVKQGYGDNFSSAYPNSSSGENRDIFQGVRTTLKANMLELKLPFIGKVTPDDGGFKTRVVAIVLREPSFSECRDFMKTRAEKLWTVRSEFGQFRKSSASVPWEDNGC